MIDPATACVGDDKTAAVGGSSPVSVGAEKATDVVGHLLAELQGSSWFPGIPTR